MGFMRQLSSTKEIAEHQSPQVPEDVKTIDDLQLHIEIEYEKKRKKPRVEDVMCRTTWMLDKKLNNRMNEIAATKEKGWKTLTYNRLIAAFLRDYDNNVPM